MRRNVEKLSETEYDVIIIGSGIYGACTAWEAASRGLKTALIDKGDFGSATSANSLKIVHGSLRYLQDLDFKRMIESSNERKTMMRIAPNLVHPMPVVMPTYGHGLKGKEVMSIALLLNDMITFDRNGPDPQKHIPAGKVISKNKCLEILPDLEIEGLSGAALWYDAQMHNSERLTLAFVHSAAETGADAANYVEANGFVMEGNKVIGVKAKDNLNGNEFEIKAKLVINTAGPWINNIIKSLNNGIKVSFCKAMNIVVKKQLFKKYAVGLTLRNSNFTGKNFGTLFIVPWRKYSIIGVYFADFNGNPSDFKIEENEIQDFINYINAIYPPAALKKKDVCFVHKGIQPREERIKNGKIKLLRHYSIYDHKKNGVDGLVTIVGVKYTTARDIAQKVIDYTAKKLGKKIQKSATAFTSVYGGDIERFNDFLADALNKREMGLDLKLINHLVYNYGTNYVKVLELCEENPELKGRVCSDSDVLKAEIVYAVRKEMAEKLTDIVLRRTELGTAGNPGDKCLKTCAEIMAAELGWDRERMDKELEEVKKVYKVEYS